MTTSLTWRFSIDAADPSAVPARIDAVMAAMLDREDAIVHDTAIGLDLEAMMVEVSVLVESLAVDTAVAHGTDVVRAALAAATDMRGSTGITFTHAEIIAV